MKLKSIIGILLIMASVFGMYFWETELRDKLIYTDVLVAAKDIKVGDVIDSGSFKTMSVTPQSVLRNALKPSDYSLYIGKICVFPVKAKSQVCSDFLSSEDMSSAKDLRVNVISDKWLFLDNPEIKSGDTADFYSMPEKLYLGSYKVVFSQGENEERFMEIYSRLEDYFLIIDKLSESKDNSLLIVPGNKAWDL